MMTKSAQLYEHVSPENIKPEVSKNGIFFPVSVEHEDLDKYEGDARSFGYHFDEGPCTIVTYEQVVGTLSEDTIELFEQCAAIKRHMKKPSASVLEFCKNDAITCDADSSELLIRYDSDYFYKDENGYWFKSTYYSNSDSTDYSVEPIRVTDESAEIYREFNKEYQRKIKQHNKLMQEALSNMQLLKETIQIEGLARGGNKTEIKTEIIGRQS